MRGVPDRERTRPPPDVARRDLARTYGLLGDWAKCDALIDGLTGTGNEIGMWSDRARMTLWQRDSERAKRYLTEVNVPAERAVFIRVMLALVADPTTPSSGDSPAFRATVDATKGTLRRQSFFQQLDAEMSAFRGDFRRALEALTRSIDAGLIDRLWIERCPLFDPMRNQMSFQAQLARVEERTKVIFEAYVSA